ncbi:amino acid ABC transporter substrate-binding protein [Tumidithrix elongata RA019]|uniref:Amino acid ABC transporter substrate-binding protein n=1 Tax=Tumidithrix elongata BACA0141 TaxID=2716417 RepID=A0AAW9PX48_9CYAN|nr:amino acid ABC transporter substrate-binding protein [Tumidithrix elongata RA019]
MRKTVAIVGLVSALLVGIPKASLAGTILEKVAKTGVLTAGARKDTVPFGYVNEKEQWVGYSIDLLERIRAKLEKDLKRPVRLQLVEVSSSDRIQMVQDRKVDIECGSTTFTWNRQKYVDFSVPFFFTGTQFLVKGNSSIKLVSDLTGKKVGVIEGTSNQGDVDDLKPAVQVVLLKNRADGVKQLQEGKIDAFASDGILLLGLKNSTLKDSNFSIVPDQPVLNGAYACMVPKDESDWRSLVNYSIFSLIEGIVDGDPKAIGQYERWFGKNGVVPYPLELNSDYFQSIVSSFERIPN